MLERVVDGAEKAKRWKRRRDFLQWRMQKMSTGEVGHC